MDQIIFTIRYERDLLLDGVRREEGWYHRRRSAEEVENVIEEAKELADFLQMDMDIFEGNKNLIIFFYVHEGFAFFDIAKRQMGELLLSCDFFSFDKFRDARYDCVIKLNFSKN